MQAKFKELLLSINSGNIYRIIILKLLLLAYKTTHFHGEKAQN